MEITQDHNRRVWDERARQGLLHTRTAPDDEFADPLKATNGPGRIDGGLDGKQVPCPRGGGEAAGGRASASREGAPAA